MYTCEDSLEQISAQLDGQLSPAETAQLEAHLRACAACRALAEDLAGLHSNMSNLNVPPPADLAANVMARIRAETPEPIPFPVKRTLPRHWRAWGAAAAMLAVVLAGTFVLWGGNSGGSNPDTTLLAVASTAPSAAPALPEEKESAIASMSIPEEKPETMVGATGAAENNIAQNQAVLPNDEGKTYGGKEDSGTQAGSENSIADAIGPKSRSSEPPPSATPAPSPVGGTPAAKPATAQNPVTFHMSTDNPDLTPETACQTLFDHIKALNHPDLGSTAPWDGAVCTGSAQQDDLAYTLAPVSLDGERYTWNLAYQGLSQNKKYYEFHLYAEVTGGEYDRVAQGGWYGVAVTDGTILTCQDDLDAYDAAVNE